MAGKNNVDPVRCGEEQVVIPAYPVQPADPNLMFLEKRVYEGSSGRVYPNPFTDKVALKKQDQTLDCWVHESLVEWSSIGRSITSLPLTCRYTRALRNMPAAAARLARRA